MEQVASDVVAGLFATPGQAMTVQKELHRIGLTDSNIDVGKPGPGQYRLDIREAETLGRAVVDGVIVGTVLGAALGALLVVVAVPEAMEHGASAILLGILMGAFWGSFFGGLGGMAIRAAANDAGAGWCEIPDEGNAVIVIARAGALANSARTVMQRCGAAALLKAKPSMFAAGSPPDSKSNVPAGPGHLSLGVPARHADTDGHSLEARSGDDHPRDEEGQTPRPNGHAGAISIPRGAFLLLFVFLIACSALWANVYLRVLWRV